MKSLLTICLFGVLLCGPDDRPQKQESFWDFLHRGGTSESAQNGGNAAMDGQSLAAALAQYFAVRSTVSGYYLSALHAQHIGDWDKAAEYTGKISAVAPNNIELRKQALVYAISAGRQAQAFAYAHDILKEDEAHLLSRILLIVEAFTKEERERAAALTDALPDNEIGGFFKPLLGPWIAAGRDMDVPSVPAKGLGALGAYHTLLARDYLGQIDADTLSAAPFLKVTDTHELIALEPAADLMAQHGAYAQAAKIYAALDEAGLAGPTIKSKLAAVTDGQAPDPDSLIYTRPQTAKDGAARVFYDMARILFLDRQDDSARIFARMATTLSPGYDAAHLLVANLDIQDGNTDSAIAQLDQVTAPGYRDDAENMLAAIWQDRGETDKAVGLYETRYARTQAPQELIRIGELYRQQEKYDQALHYYNRAADQLGVPAADDWQLYYARGMTLERLGRWDEAEKDLETALSFRPEHPELLNYLGYSWADKGHNLEQAELLLKKATELAPDQGHIADSYGWVLYRLGKYDAAVAELERAAQLMPYDPVINDHLGDALWHAGRKGEARFQWRRVLNSEPEDKLRAEVDSKLSGGLKPVKDGDAALLHAEGTALPAQPVSR